MPCQATREDEGYDGTVGALMTCVLRGVRAGFERDVATLGLAAFSTLRDVAALPPRAGRDDPAFSGSDPREVAIVSIANFKLHHHLKQ